jgi:MerR family regulatory protein
VGSATLAIEYATWDACRLSGVTPRQLRYWARLGYLHPTQYSPGGDRPGNRGDCLGWPHLEVRKAIAIRRMLDNGISLQTAGRLASNGRYATLLEDRLPEVEP